MFRFYQLKILLYWRLFRCQNEIVKEHYRTLLQNLTKPLVQLPLVAIDLEMTGLDSLEDQILSIGVVPIEQGQIILAKAAHKLVKIKGSVGDSATIHGILDVDLQQALTLDEALRWFFQFTRGKILIAHHAPLDLAFLQANLRLQDNHRVKLMAIDTSALERKRLLYKHTVLQQGSLRLGACRQRYNLPVYAAHNAVVDALACGELLLAQAMTMGEDDLSLSDLLS